MSTRRAKYTTTSSSSSSSSSSDSNANKSPLGEPLDPSIKDESNSKNYMSCAISSVKGLFSPLREQWSSLTPNQRFFATLIGVPILVLPIVWLLILSPWILALVVAGYSMLFGFRTFVTHTEDALKEHFNVPEESIKSVHQNADKLRGKAQILSEKFGGNTLDFVTHFFYSTLTFSMKSLEWIIANLQWVSGKLKIQEQYVKEKKQKTPKKEI